MGSSTELILVLAAAGGVAVAYATNLGGFKKWLDNLFKNQDWGGSSNITTGSQRGAYGGPSRTPAGVTASKCTGGYVPVGGKCLCNHSVKPCPAGQSLIINSNTCACNDCATLGKYSCKPGYKGVAHKGGVGCDCVKILAGAGYAESYQAGFSADSYPDNISVS